MAREVNAWLAELVGTFLLVFIGGGAGVVAGTTGTIIPALAHGLALFVIVIVIGRVSGAHVNPAVTLSLASIGKFSWARVPGYLVAQFIGAGLGALGVVGIYGTTASVAPTLTKGVGMGTGLLAEALGAGILIIAIIASVADTRANLANGMAALAIGLALACAVFVVGPVTGAGVNPALALSPYAIDAIFQHMPELGATQIVAYLVGPIVGGVIAAWLYQIISGTAAVRSPAVKQPVATRKR